jgi:hypothetical protein
MVSISNPPGRARTRSGCGHGWGLHDGGERYCGDPSRTPPDAHTFAGGDATAPCRPPGSPRGRKTTGQPLGDSIDENHPGAAGNTPLKPVIRRTVDLDQLTKTWAPPGCSRLSTTFRRCNAFFVNWIVSSGIGTPQGAGLKGIFLHCTEGTLLLWANTWMYQPCALCMIPGNLCAL